MAARCAVKGMQIPVSGAAKDVLRRYLDQKALAKLGYVTPIESLSTFEAGCFLVIDDELGRKKGAVPEELEEELGR